MSTTLLVGSGNGGVGQADVSLVAKTTIIPNDQADIVDYLVTNRNSIAYYQETDLANGDNLISIPGGATNRVAGVIIVPDVDADFQAILKSISTAADSEGFLLAKRTPSMLSFETPALPDGTNARFYLKWAGYGKLNVAVTGDAGTDKIALAGHGMADGTRVKFRALTDGSVPGGLTENVLYYVVGGGANDFQLALTEGGGAIDLTTTGTDFVLSTADHYKFYWF